MKRLISLLAATLSLAACARVQLMLDRDENPYAEPPFYSRYLSSTNQLDRQITQKLEGLRLTPSSTLLHNELGALLVVKGFPKDAEREFRRALRSDDEFYPAWYNIALVRESLGDEPGAMRALRRTLRLKPGHPQAHFQLGLLYEKQGRNEDAIDHYARAYLINRALLDARINPRIIDSRLTDRALLRIYPTEHSKRSLQIQGAPSGYVAPASDTKESISPQAAPGDIVTPSAPVTDPSMQKPAPPATPPAAKPPTSATTGNPSW